MSVQTVVEERDLTMHIAIGVVRNSYGMAFHFHEKREKMESKITMGSLFSGSGGFELASQMAGIVPVWASEIEPFPRLVTWQRFPEMLHLGNIKKIEGGKIPKVDIIT